MDVAVVMLALDIFKGLTEGFLFVESVGKQQSSDSKQLFSRQFEGVRHLPDWWLCGWNTHCALGISWE